MFHHARIWNRAGERLTFSSRNVHLCLAFFLLKLLKLNRSLGNVSFAIIREIEIRVATLREVVLFLRRKSSTSRVPSETETVVCFNKHSSRRCPGRFISQGRDVQARTCAKVAFLSIIITGDDYRKGQRPLTISDNRPDNREKLFLRRIGRLGYSTRIIRTHTHIPQIARGESRAC